MPRDRSGRAAGAAERCLQTVAVVCLLAASVQGRGVNTAPAAANNIIFFRHTYSHLDSSKVECPVSLRLGQRSGGGQWVTVSAPDNCRCEELELSVLQRRGIPCSPDDNSCSWMRAHSIREITNSSAEFLVSVGGQFRPRAACRPQGFESKRHGRRRSARLFDGEPTFIDGIDLPSWNVSISATERGGRLEVRVLRQMDGSGSGSYFPELFVTLYRPPDEARWPPRRLARRRVPFTPADGSTVQFSSSLPGHKVDVRPAGSWVCQGANDGCQKRYAPVDELLELTERARAARGIEA